jgi:hypothetical protein
MKVRAHGCVSELKSCQLQLVITGTYVRIITSRKAVLQELTDVFWLFFTLFVGYSHVDSGQSPDGYPSICKLKTVSKTPITTIEERTIIIVIQAIPALPETTTLCIQTFKK